MEIKEEYNPQQIEKARRVHLNANYASLFRIPASLIAAALTLMDAHPAAKVGFNAAIEVSDGEGKYIERYGNGSFERGEVKTTGDAISALSETLKEGSPFSEWVLSLDGRWLDERMDKYAQHIRRIALTVKGELGATHTIIPFIRDELVSRAREHYSALGVDGVEAAGKIGKAKTVAMASVFIGKAAFGDKHKHLTDGAAYLATGLCVISAIDYMSKYEQAYHENVLGLERLSYGQYALNGFKRTLAFTQEKRQEQVSSQVIKIRKYVSAPEPIAEEAA